MKTWLKPPPESIQPISLTAGLTNQSTDTLRFPNGLDVWIQVGRNSQFWRFVELKDPSVTSLAPSQQVTVNGSTSLSGYGNYELTGSVSYTH